MARAGVFIQVNRDLLRQSGHQHIDFVLHFFSIEPGIFRLKSS
jgi:hypothetical protein